MSETRRKRSRRAAPGMHQCDSHPSGLVSALHPGTAVQLIGTEIVRVSLCWACPSSRSTSSSPDCSLSDAVLDVTMHCFDDEGVQIEYVSAARPNLKFAVHHRRKHNQVNATRVAVRQAQQRQVSSAAQTRDVCDQEGDVVEIDLAHCSKLVQGFLLSAVLFNAGRYLSSVSNLHCRVETIASLPYHSNDTVERKLLANVPLNFADDSPQAASLFGIMLRRQMVVDPTVIRADAIPTGRMYYWELVAIDETLDIRDVVSMHEAARRRGLCDPQGYLPPLLPHPLIEDLKLFTHGAGGGDDVVTDDDENDAIQVASEIVFALDSPSQHLAARPPLSKLLHSVPRVVREGKRQYNVGRPVGSVNQLEEVDGSDDEETVVDAMRAVVPRFETSRVIRFGERTYNVGSDVETLKKHYVANRTFYEDDDGLETMGQLPGQSCSAGLSSSGQHTILATPSHNPLHPLRAHLAGPSCSVQRDVEDETRALEESMRTPVKPSIPPEMSAMMESQRSRALVHQQHSNARIPRSPFHQGGLRPRRASLIPTGGPRSARLPANGSTADPHAPTPFKLDMRRNVNGMRTPSVRMDSRSSMHSLSSNHQLKRSGRVGTATPNMGAVAMLSDSSTRLPRLSVNTHRQSLASKLGDSMILSNPNTPRILLSSHGGVAEEGREWEPPPPRPRDRSRTDEHSNSARNSDVPQRSGSRNGEVVRGGGGSESPARDTASEGVSPTVKDQPQLSHDFLAALSLPPPNGGRGMPVYTNPAPSRVRQDSSPVSKFLLSIGATGRGARRQRRSSMRDRPMILGSLQAMLGSLFPTLGASSGASANRTRRQEK